MTKLVSTAFTLIVLTASALLVGCTTTSSPQSASTASASTDGLLSAAKLYDEISVSQNVNQAEPLLAKEYSLIDTQGRIVSRQDWFDEARSGKTKYSEGRSEEMSAEVLGNFGVVRGIWRQVGTSDGKAFNERMRYTTIYVLRDGRWQVYSDQVTPLKA